MLIISVLGIYPIPVYRGACPIVRRCGLSSDKTNSPNSAELALATVGSLIAINRHRFSEIKLRGSRSSGFNSRLSCVLSHAGKKPIRLCVSAT